MKTVDPAPRRKKFRPLFVISIALLGWSGLFGFGPVAWLLLLIWHLATGWFRHPWVNLPHLHWDPLTLVTSTASAILGVLMVHRFVQFLRPQPFSVTLRVMAILLSTTAAAIAMTGIVHELSWLGRSRVIVSNRSFPKILAISQGKQLHLILLDLAERGVFPRTVEELAVHEPSAASLVRYQPHSESEHYERFSLLQPGTDPRELPADAPLMVALEADKSHHLVVFADGSVKSVPSHKFEALLSP